MAKLNSRFRAAESSNDMTKVGIIMRAWDGLNAPGRPWAPCQANQFCARYRDRFATSIIYPGYGDVYATEGGGLVIRPEEVELNCAYYSDGGSQGAICNPPGRWRTNA